MTNFSGGPLERLRQRLLAKPPKKPPLSPQDEQLLRQQHDRQANLLAQYRPGEGEWLGLGLLLMVLDCSLLWAGLILLSLTTVDGLVQGDRWLRGVLIGLFFMAGYYRGRWLAEWSRGEFWSVRLLTFVGVILLARFSSYLLAPFSGPVTSAPLFSPSLVINTIFFWWALLSGEKVARLLLNLYVRPQEVAVEEGGSGDNVTGWVDRQQNYRWLKDRYVIRIFVIAASVTLPTLLDPLEPNLSLVGGLIFLLVLTVPLALLVYSWLRFRYLRSVWQLGRLAEPVALPGRWWGYLVGFGVLLGLIALVLPRSLKFNLADKYIIPPPVATPVPRTPLPRGATPTPTPPRPAPEPGLSLPDWLGPLINVLLAVVVVVFLLFLLSKVDWQRFLDWPGIKLKWNKWRTGWPNWLAWLRNWFKRPAWDAPDAESTDPVSRRGWLNRFSRDSLPGEPRAQVRYYYRQTLRKAAQAGLPRQPSQTPEEFSTYLQTQVPPDEVAPLTEAAGPVSTAQDVASLSQLYEEARFSPHKIDQTQASRAGEQAGRLSGALRRLCRSKK